MIMEQTGPRHRQIGRVAGVDLLVAPGAWQAAIVFYVLGLVVTLIAGARGGVLGVLLQAAAYGVLGYVVLVLHSIGHMLTSWLVGAPVEAILITSLRHVNLFDRTPRTYPRGVQMWRALGGPLVNLLVGTGALGWYVLFSQPALAFFGGLNVAYALLSLLPFPSLDGWAIWGDLFGLPR